MAMTEAGVRLTTAGQSGQQPQAPPTTSTSSTSASARSPNAPATAAAASTNTAAGGAPPPTPSSPTAQAAARGPSPSSHTTTDANRPYHHHNPPAQVAPSTADTPRSHLQNPTSSSKSPTLQPVAAEPSSSSSSSALPLSHHRVAPQTTSVSPDPAPARDAASPSSAAIHSASDSAPAPPHRLSAGSSSSTTSSSNIAASPGPLSPTSRPPPSTLPPATAQKSIDTDDSAAVANPLSPPATQPRRPAIHNNNNHHHIQRSYSDGTVDSLPPSAPDAASHYRRAPASRSSLGVATSDGPPPSLRTQRAHGADGSSSSAATTPETLSPRDSIQSQRELFILKSLSHPSTAPADERRASTQRPPVSYKPPGSVAGSSSAQAAQGTQPNNSNQPVRVPPIRSFRSSGSRKSLTLDMNYYKNRVFDGPEDPSDPSHDRTLRALEGRQIQDMLQMTPPTSAGHEGFDADDGGDVFLKIAREEPPQRAAANGGNSDDTQSTVSRVYRSHRRPLSTNVASYRPKSPPYVGRRLSDQRDTSRSRADDDGASEVTRSATLRGFTRDQKASSTHPSEAGSSRGGPPTSLRPSPLAPRSLAYQDPGADNPTPPRRRSSATEQNTPPPVRNSIYHKSSGSANAYGKSYSSSPLVRSFDFHGQPHQGEGAVNGTTNGLEGTESTASTTAPSTMWDELDDLKSRIHRLELTGKLPPTSGAAVSRLTDDRPPTATTTVTTTSSSPKRGAAANTEVSTTSSQKEAYPILHSALSKSKPFLSPDIFRALEAASNDAMALSSMMGQPGLPGPISSAASAIGSSVGPVTDRQLRRKADSVCRSLTELCVALGEDSAHSRQTHASAQKVTTSQPQTDSPSTPTIPKSYSTGMHVRRPSGSSLPQQQQQQQQQPQPQPQQQPQILPKLQTSPSRSMSKFEERRNTILNGSALPSPRPPVSQPTTPQDPSVSRRSSLLVARTRRAVTEEPEEQTGRKSSLLRTRRGGTEEPEESRPTTMLRSRRGTNGEDDDEMRFRAPSRAYTETNTTRGPAREYTEVATSTRGATREYAPQQQLSPHTAVQGDPNTPSALPRRRFVSSHITSPRLSVPPSSALPTKKTVERSIPAPPASTTGAQSEAPSSNLQTRYTEEQRPPARHLSLGQGIPLSRTGSLTSRRYNRDHTVGGGSNIAAAGYR